MRVYWTMTGLLPLLAALPLVASDDATEIVKRFIAADTKNWEQARQYTYVKQADYFNVEKDGSVKKDRSETHEVIFVEGGSYNKLIARNDKPLDAKEQAKEDRKLQQAAQDRRKQHSGPLHRTVSLASHDDLVILFENRLLGEEEIRGHKAWVILCTPKEGHIPANAHEKDVLSFQEKLWINQADDQLVKSVYTVVGPHVTLMIGSTVTWEFEKINDDAWLGVSSVLDGRVQFAKFIRPAVRTEYHNSKFQKFDVQSTITVESIK